MTKITVKVSTPLQELRTLTIAAGDTVHVADEKGPLITMVTSETEGGVAVHVAFERIDALEVGAKCPTTRRA